MLEYSAAYDFDFGGDYLSWGGDDGQIYGDAVYFQLYFPYATSFPLTAAAQRRHLYNTNSHEQWARVAYAGWYLLLATRLQRACAKASRAFLASINMPAVKAILSPFHHHV